MSKIVYDGEGVVFGRVASRVAKDLLKGNDVGLINCEKMIISGDKKLFAKKILMKKDMGSGGSMKGPKYPRTPEKLVKRMIRGMLPRDRARGRDAFRRLKCYSSGSEYAIDKGVEIIKPNTRKPMKFSSVAEVLKLIGAGKSLEGSK